MGKVNIDWVKDQFAQAKIRVNVGKAVLKMLDTWQTIELKDEDAQKVLDILSKVAMNHAIVAENKDEVWVDVIPGTIKVTDIVRVKSDAYSDPELGPIHNGKRGVIVAIRSGDVIVKYENTPGDSNAVDPRHSPYKLQKRVR